MSSSGVKSVTSAVWLPLEMRMKPSRSRNAERLAQGRATDAEQLGQLDLPELLTRLQLADVRDRWEWQAHGVLGRSAGVDRRGA